MKTLASFSLCLFAFACGDDVLTDAGPTPDAPVEDTFVTDTPPQGDTGIDAPLMECAEDLPPLEEGGEGHAMPLAAAAGEARAGRLAEADIPPDPSDLLVWRAGDWVLANENIAVVVEDVGTSDGYEVWGPTSEPTSSAGSADSEPSPLTEAARARRSIVAMAIRPHVQQIQTCYERLLRSNSTLEGRVELYFSLDDTGAVSNVRTTQTTDAIPTLGGCIANIIQGIRFEPGMAGDYEYPFVFGQQN